MDLKTATDLASNPLVITGLLAALDLLLRKIPKAKPVLQIVSVVALYLDGLLGRVPGLKNVEPPKSPKKK